MCSDVSFIYRVKKSLAIVHSNLNKSKSTIINQCQRINVLEDISPLVGRGGVERAGSVLDFD